MASDSHVYAARGTYPLSALIHGKGLKNPANFDLGNVTVYEIVDVAAFSMTGVFNKGEEDNPCLHAFPTGHIALPQTERSPVTVSVTLSFSGTATSPGNNTMNGCIGFGTQRLNFDSGDFISGIFATFGMVVDVTKYEGGVRYAKPEVMIEPWCSSNQQNAWRSLDFPEIAMTYNEGTGVWNCEFEAEATFSWRFTGTPVTPDYVQQYCTGRKFEWVSWPEGADLGLPDDFEEDIPMNANKATMNVYSAVYFQNIFDQYNTPTDWDWSVGYSASFPAWRYRTAG